MILPPNKLRFICERRRLRMLLRSSCDPERHSILRRTIAMWKYLEHIRSEETSWFSHRDPVSAITVNGTTDLAKLRHLRRRARDDNVYSWFIYFVTGCGNNCWQDFWSWCLHCGQWIFMGLDWFCSTHIFFAFLVLFFNNCMHLDDFPTAWKEQLVAPIPVPRGNCGPRGGYRSISLLSPFEVGKIRLV